MIARVTVVMIKMCLMCVCVLGEAESQSEAKRPGLQGAGLI